MVLAALTAKTGSGFSSFQSPFIEIVECQATPSARYYLFPGLNHCRITCQKISTYTHILTS
jgi:hypothetical protein